MLIDSDILYTWGGIAKKYKKGEFIFHEGEIPRFYFQIVRGGIKMYNTNYDGKEFTQGQFSEGDSFGEPPLFIDEVYPATAVAIDESIVLKISKEKYFEILDEYPHLQKKVIRIFARKIYNKTIAAREIINNSPESRILAFLKYYKRKNHDDQEEVVIPYTRQEIANYTGLRVETVIRTLSKMREKKQVKIINRKLIF